MVYSVEKMYILPDAGIIKAFADVCINDVMTIRGCRVLKGKKGLFLSMPQEQGKDCKWYDQVVFRSASEYECCSRVVLAHYVSQTGEPVLEDISAPANLQPSPRTAWTNIQ